mmetsp:Transcript_30719/g.60489  ORF Transcript_30719/g.60489 Transcript_30719/m.60489 type:complete len:306 (+) Transcript_30719:1179-2096(+)
MRDVHTQTGVDLRLLELRSRVGNRSSIIVRACCSSPENDVHVGVSHCMDNCGNALLGDTEKSLLCACRPAGIDGDLDVPVCAVLEPNRHRQTGCQFSMELTLRCACADCAPCDEVSDVLGHECVKKLAGHRDTNLVNISQKFPSDAQTLVDLECLVKVGVVDQALPADCCAGFLEVHAHQHEDIVSSPVGLRLQTPRVVKSRVRIMNGAGADDEGQLVGLSIDDAFHFLAGCKDSFLCCSCHGNFFHEELRLYDCLDLFDVEVVKVLVGEVLAKVLHFERLRSSSLRHCSCCLLHLPLGRSTQRL